MFSQNDLINQLHSKINSFNKTLDEIIDKKPQSNPRPSILPPQIANNLLKSYQKTKDGLQKEYDEIIELRKKMEDSDNPELLKIDSKISEIQKKLSTANNQYDAQKRANEHMASIREARYKRSLEKSESTALKAPEETKKFRI